MRRRRRWTRIACVLLAGAVACKFSTQVAPTDGDEPDTPMIPCDAPTVTCADGVTLRASCEGAEDTLVTCPWGCLANAPGPRCGELVPSGGGVLPGDLDAMGTNDFTLTGTINGSTGEIGGSSAASLGVPYRLGSNNVAVFRFKRLTIGALKLEGTRAIALVGVGDLTVSGVVDARGACNAGAGSGAGAGGFEGNNEGDGDGPGGGNGDDTPNRGAGGGGHGALGGSGGGNTHLGGTTFGDPQISMLVGGAGGGGAKTSRGGGGGGAIQLVSTRSITIGVGGGINAGGCGGIGGDGNTDAGGGGGGAGGAILLEAPRITIAGVLAVNGGAGGNRTNGDGSAGRLDRTLATAPTGAGRGAAGATFAGENGTGAGNNQANAGGGGGVGRIRLNTGTGAVTELDRTGGVLSPDIGDGAATTATHARATVR